MTPIDEDDLEAYWRDLGRGTPPPLSSVTTTIRITISSSTASSGPITLSVGPSASNIQFFEKLFDEFERRQRQLYAWTQEAIQKARETLHKTDDDPSGVLPRRPRREASKRLHSRPKFRGRICAGSSRYRVMWS